MDIFSTPVFLLGSVLATLWGALFHILFGKQLRDLVLYFFISFIGLFVGQAMADILGFHWLLVGQLHFVEATAGCWIAMLIARWLQV